MAPELENSFFLLCDVIITVLVLGPKTRWSIKISFPTVAMAVSSLVIEALWCNLSSKPHENAADVSTMRKAILTLLQLLSHRTCSSITVSAKQSTEVSLILMQQDASCKTSFPLNIGVHTLTYQKCFLEVVIELGLMPHPHLDALFWIPHTETTHLMITFKRIIIPTDNS